MAIPNTTTASTSHGMGGPLRLSAIDWLAFVLLLVGSINWGLVGVLNFDLVAAIFGTMTPAARVVYSLVGLSAVWSVVFAGRYAMKR